MHGASVEKAYFEASSMEDAGEPIVKTPGGVSDLLVAHAGQQFFPTIEFLSERCQDLLFVVKHRSPPNRLQYLETRLGRFKKGYNLS